MGKMVVDADFYRGKKVFVTGHTGFKGSWLCRILVRMGADVTGYSLPSPTEPSLFALAGIEKSITSIVGDVRDFAHFNAAIREAQPDIVLHLAAQPIVRESYRDPRTTYETNVMGTVNLLECIRTLESPVRSVLNVTTDKVYRNNEWEWGYRENEPLDGFDPYSNSKSCSELVTHSYNRAFFSQGETAVSTARAGNVIGGGDFAADRIIPDCVRAVERGETIAVRNPFSVRPYQHVLEPLFAYLLIAQAQYTDKGLAGYYNVGPDEEDCLTTGALVNLFCEKWGEGLCWENRAEGGPHEATFLRLDCSRLKKVFDWRPSWRIDMAIEKTVEWTKAYLHGENVGAVMDRQIDAFMEKAGAKG